MTTLTPPPKPVGLTPQFALQLAWIAWIVLLLTPLILLAGATPRILNQPAPRGAAAITADAWFIGVLAYVALAAPAAFFVRGRIFRDYWFGHPVSPRAYLTGSLVVWATLEVGGILSLVGCLVTASPPMLLPGLVVLAVFTLSWPNGTAMTARGDTDDPERYSEPR